MNTAPSTTAKQEVVTIESPRQMPSVYIPTQSDWQFMIKWGQDALKSNLLPYSIKTPEAAAIILLKGRELNLSFMTSIHHIHVINGKPTMSAELIQAQARKNLPGLAINILKSTGTEAEIEFVRPERNSRPYIETFSIEDAKKANLMGKDSWRQYPKAMLWSRCITAGLRKVCPEALMGVSYTPEELGAVVDHEGNVIESTTVNSERSIESKKVVSVDSTSFRVSSDQWKALYDAQKKNGWSKSKLNEVILEVCGDHKINSQKQYDEVLEIINVSEEAQVIDAQEMSHKELLLKAKNEAIKAAQDFRVEEELKGGWEFNADPIYESHF